jgi:hypothetical protein
VSNGRSYNNYASALSGVGRFAECLFELGDVLNKQGKPGAAQAHLQEALGIFVETKGTDSKWARDTRDLLADVSR